MRWNLKEGKSLVVSHPVTKTNSLYSLQVVGGANNDHPKDRLYDFGEPVVRLNFLEVELGQHVKVVGQLDDVVELEQEAHRMVWVVLPGQRKLLEKSIAHHHVGAPQKRG